MSQSGITFTQYFLRMGNWCKCERSFNSHDNFFENGVSVYKCEQIDEQRWRGCEAAFEKRERLYQGRERKHLAGDGTIDWYIVNGSCVGTGSDQEPLLKRIKPVIRVAWDGACFIKTAIIDTLPTANHPGYPKCVCKTLQDFLNET